MVTRAGAGETAVVSRQDYFPFGGEISGSASNGQRQNAGAYGFSTSIAQKFTGKERDQETGLDYFLARYYSPAQGRFTSPDEFTGGIVDPFTGQQVSQPGPLPYAEIRDPQTLNKYAYVRNNPLRYTDPDGHCTDVLTCSLWVGEVLGYGAAAGAGALGGVVLWLASPAVPGASTSPNPGHYFAESIDKNFAQSQNAQQAQSQGQQSTPGNPKFEPSPKHGPEKRGDASAGPKDGQTALDSSVQVKDSSPRRVGVDRANGQIVVLDQTSKGKFHGHVRSWKELTDQQRNALIKARLADKRGNILPEEKQ